MNKPSYVYMLASAPYGTLYIGVTSDMVKRVWQHREDFVHGFTKTYSVHLLVWFEIHNDMLSAIAREKQLKKWNRAWKVDLINKSNPRWRDLYPEFCACAGVLWSRRMRLHVRGDDGLKAGFPSPPLKTHPESACNPTNPPRPPCETRDATASPSQNSRADTGSLRQFHPDPTSPPP